MSCIVLHGATGARVGEVQITQQASWKSTSSSVWLARCSTVERLVELRFTDQGIAPTHRPPIQLELIDDEHARNWEGVVRLGRRGMLIATDQYPSTMLAFVPVED